MKKRWFVVGLVVFILSFSHFALFAQAPIISSFSPLSGPVGSSVTILGQNFDAAHNVVLFGGIAANITSSGSNKIVADVPSSAISGTVTIINLSTGLSAVSGSLFDVTFTIPDKLTASNLEVLTQVPVATTRLPVISADLNGDGKPDIIVANGNSVSIYQNINSGSAINNNSFAPKFDLPVFGPSYKIQVADVDGDGKPDIIVPEYPNSLAIYKNMSSPGSALSAESFQIVSFSFAIHSTNVEIADMDGDGKPDIVCVNPTYDHIVVLKNTAAAGQLNSTSFSQVANIPYSGGDIVVSDLDNDGKPDIFCSSGAQMFHNQVSGSGIADNSFTEIDFPADGAAGHATAADINGDGKPEILIADDANGFLYLYQNTSADGALSGDSFTLKSILFSGSKANNVSVSDLDGDGKPDVIVANSGARTISIFKNIFNKSNPAGPWLDAKLLDDVGTQPLAVAIADLNSDGKPDLILSDADGFVTLIKNEPVGIPVISSFSPVMAQGGSVISIKGKNFSSDENNVKVYFGTRPARVQSVSDSVLQVVVPLGVISDRIGVSIVSLKRTAWSAQAFKGTYPSKTNITPADFKFSLRVPLAQFSRNIKLADFDGDGFLDMIYIENINGQITVQRNNGNTKTIDCTLFTKALSVANPKQFTGFIIGDINNDGLPDIICDGGYFLNSSTKGNIQFASFKTLSSNPVQDVQPFFLEDLDGDGRLDIVTSSGTFRNGTTENSAAPELKTEVDLQGFIMALADFDGDGKPDILNGQQSGGSLSIGANVSSPGFLSDSSFSKALVIGTSSAPISVMDLDNDGKIDIASDGMVYRNNSTVPGNFSFAATVGNWSTDFAFVNDLNGDGLPDLVAARFPENFFIEQAQLIQGQPSIVTDSVRLACNDLSPIGDQLIDPDFVAAEDLNNDNKPELIFYDDRLDQLLIFENTSFAETDPSPHITAITPAQGNINTRVTISGNNFDAVAANNTVFFGNTQAVIASASKSSLTVAVPAGAGYGPVTVNNNTTKRSAQSAAPFKVLIGDGAGISINTATFNAIQPLLTKIKGGNFVFGDFNHDGKKELAISALDSIFIYKSTSTDNNNNPTGFSKITSFASGPITQQLFLIDLNGDGKPELVVSENDGLRVYENTSNAECGISFVSNLVEDNVHPDEITFGDMDGDGKPDIIVAFGGITRIYLNNSGLGSISFRPWVYVDLPLELSWMHAVDFDGDGKIDLIALNSNTIVVYRNLGGTADSTINFAAPVSILSPPGSYSLLIADMDGDGKPDVVLGNNGTNSVDIYKNNSTQGNISAASLSGPVSISAGALINQLFVGDFNGDGKPDIYATIVNKFQIDVFANNSTPGTIDNSSFSDPVIFSTGNEVVTTFPMDLNNDGKQDIMFSLTDNVNTSISFMENNTLASAIELFSSGATRTYIPHNPAILVDSAILVNNTGTVNLSSVQISISQNYQSGSDVLSFASGSSFGNIAGSFDAASGILTLSSAGATATNTQWQSALRAVTFQSTVKASGLRTIGFTASNGAIISVQVTAGIIVTVIPPPVITSISPLFATAGDNVTITGANFTDASAVSFGATAVKSFTLNSPTSVSAVLASGASGNVRVSTPYGAGQLGGFTYVSVPVVTAGGPTTFNPGGSVVLSTPAISGLAYQWAKDGTDISSAQGATYTATATGNYTVSVLFNSGEQLISAPSRVNAVFTLPADNFTVSAISATCRGSNDGSINISAKQSMPYQVKVSGGSLNDTYNFNTTKELDNLEPGDYNVCITIAAEPDFEQCFDVTVGQPQDLSVYTAVNLDEQTVSIQMSGGEEYEVQLNGVNYNTSQSQLTLHLAKGNNELVVSTGKSCQGVVEKRIITNSEIIPYPNPFSNILTVDIGSDLSKTAEVTVVDLFGKKVYQSQLKCINGKLILNLASLGSGMYTLQLKLDNSETVYKIWKE